MRAIKKIVVNLIRVFKKNARYLDIRKDDEIKRDTEILNEIFCFERKSYSQEGEDLILEEIFKSKTKGFFIDVGAHHPARYSNTYLFYLKGWRGINIEPNKEGIELFFKYRPEDINLNYAISLETSTSVFYKFKESALNTLNKNRASELIKDYGNFEEESVKTTSLEEIWEKYVGNDKKVDFLSIDVEGSEKKVLDSNDWDKFRPSYILIEILNVRRDSDGKVNNDINDYLSNRGYIIISNTMRTFFYKDIR